MTSPAEILEQMVEADGFQEISFSMAGGKTCQDPIKLVSSEFEKRAEGLNFKLVIKRYSDEAAAFYTTWHDELLIPMSQAEGVDKITVSLLQAKNLGGSLTAAGPLRLDSDDISLIIQPPTPAL